MRVEYELTFEDFAEGMTAAGLLAREKGSPTRTSLWAWLLLAFGTALIVAGGGYALVKSIREQTFDPRAAADAVAEVAPWFALSAMSVTFAFAARSGSGAGRLVHLSVALLSAVAGGVILYFRTNHSPLTFIPWLLVVSYGLAQWRALVGNASVRRLWPKMIHLHGPLAATLTESGLLVEQGASRLAHDWHAFRGWAETSNLFLLFLSEVSFHMIPKRAFDPSRLSEVRAALRAAMEPKRRAFPVVPVARAAAAGEGNAASIPSHRSAG